MSIELNIESEGLQGIYQVLNQLKKFGSNLGGVELHSRDRKPYNVDGRDIGGKASNATILKGLKQQGRDFITSSQPEVEAIADSSAKEIERRIGAELSKASFTDAWSSKRAKQTKSHASRVRRSQSAFDRSADDYFSGSMDENDYFGVDASDIGKAPGSLKLVEQGSFARQLAAACLKKAMFKWMEQISGRVESQSSSTGEINQNYSAGWKNLKPKITGGWLKPVGKASGQLLDNLNPDGLGARNIRLKKS